MNFRCVGGAGWMVGWLDGWMVPCCSFSFLDFKFFCLDFFLLLGWVWAS